VRKFPLILLAFFSISCASSAQRHERVAQRRAGVAIICHRGAHEFAHENTLEAYRATFELGGDGNEIDIRQTKDGVLVLFHDDMLDVHLKAFGDISDYSYEQLQKFEFRNPGPFGDACRIPTLKEVFELHKKYAGLIHLDIKVPNIDTKITKMLDEMDMWNHISNVSEYNSENIRKNPQLHPRPYKAGLYEDHSEVFPDAIAAVLAKPGKDVICDDPRGAAVALGRRPGKPTTKPVLPATKAPLHFRRLATLPLVAQIRDSTDSSAEAITARAWAVERLLQPGLRGVGSASVEQMLAALEFRARHRTLHPDWRYHGLDGATALRALLELGSSNAVQLSREIIWLNDPALIPLNNPQYKIPSSWVDFRVKNVVFPGLEYYRNPEAHKLCREYLALSDDEAKKIGPPQFEPAAHTLLTISPKTETAIELMHHRLQVVRGRAILDCLARHNEAWAAAALKAAPHALAYITPQ
jgi:hypothetical protein